MSATEDEREAERIATAVGMVPDTGQHRVTARAALLGIQYGLRRQGRITDARLEAARDAVFQALLGPEGPATADVAYRCAVAALEAAERVR